MSTQAILIERFAKRSFRRSFFLVGSIHGCLELSMQRRFVRFHKRGKVIRHVMISIEDTHRNQSGNSENLANESCVSSMSRSRDADSFGRNWKTRKEIGIRWRISFPTRRKSQIHAGLCASRLSFYSPIVNERFSREIKRNGGRSFSSRDSFIGGMRRLMAQVERWKWFPGQTCAGHRSEGKVISHDEGSITSSSLEL